MPAGDQYVQDLISMRRFSTRVRVEAVAYGDRDKMRQPRVAYLKFELVPLRPNYEIALSSDSEAFALGRFTCRWIGNQLEARPYNTTLRDPVEAELELREHLDTWEAWAELTGYGPVAFELRHCAVVDEDPPDGQSANEVSTFSSAGGPSYEPVPRRLATPPPVPADGFHSSPLVEALRDRLRLVLDYLALPAVEGYFLLSAIEGTHGGRREAAAAMNVDVAVLRRLGDLTARYSLNSGRKHPRAADPEAPRAQGLSRDDEIWIVNCCVNLLIRFGQSNPFDHPRLTLEILDPERDHNQTSARGLGT